MENMNIYPLNEIIATPPERFSTGINYFDEILGGGFVEGSTIIMAGLPGAGKSSLLNQVSYKLAENSLKVLYIAGEENKEQIKMRTERLGINSGLIFLCEDVEVEKIVEAVDFIQPQVLIIDSLQMLNSNTIKTAPGTPSQMRHGLMTLCKLSKDRKITTVFVGHSTKGGYIAGLQSFQHMVDTVLYLGINEDDTRFIKINKNRFGQTGLSQNLYMTKYGLFDRNDVTEPFAKDNAFNGEYTLEDVERVTERCLTRSIIIAGYKWLKEKVQNDPNVKLCNGTATLTSSYINNLTKGNPVWGKVVSYSFNWLEKHSNDIATPLQN